MNLTELKGLAAAFGLILLLAPRSWGQAAVKPGGSLWIEGDSTLHRWSSTSTAVELSFTPAAGSAMTVEAIKASRIKGVGARIPVVSLKSGDGSLDKNMLKAMNAEKFPEIVYKLVSYEPPKTGDGGVLKTKTTGELTIAGKTKTVAIDMEFEPGPDGLRVRGAYQLKMSDYGITPPKLFLGTIKTRDPVTVRFDLSLNAPKETSK